MLTIIVCIYLTLDSGGLVVDAITPGSLVHINLTWPESFTVVVP